ncbi:MAG: methionine aminotransferase [Flavihumibacter sp.]
MSATPDKLPFVGPTIFTAMSALAAEEGAVNLGQGFPDFPMSGQLIDLVTTAMRQQHNQYAPMAGWLPLREAIAGKISFLYNATVDPVNEITITPGGTYAIYTALTCLLQPGDEVIVFEPAYDSYIPNIVLNGAKPVLIPLTDSFRIPWQQVEAAIGPRTRAIIINSPHNPTGTVLQEADICALQAIISRHPLFLVSDEVYEHLVFDNKTHLSLLRYPDLRARAFVCFSFGKTYHCTGWKIGYAVAPPALTTVFRKVHQFNCFSCHTPVQVALAAYLGDRDAYLQLGKTMQAKRDYFISLLQKSRFDLLPSGGSYFICARYHRINNMADIDFVRWLTITHKVTGIPVSAFYREATDSRLVRFCFAKKESTLEAATARLCLV